MSFRRILLILLPVMIALLSIFPVCASAEEAGNALVGEAGNASPGEERSIYVGDIITLKVTAKGLSADDVAERFHAFEIVEISEEGDGFLISVRTFVTGEQRIILGEKEIVIDVRSTLDDIVRDDIFEADRFAIEPGLIFHWRLLFYVSGGIFALSGGFVLWKAMKNRNGKKMSPLESFLRRSGSLSADEDNYFVDLTFYFKEYLQAMYKCRIIGKTSDEIIGELNNIKPLGAMLPDIREWLTECDRLKFTGVTASAGEKQEHFGRLLVLAQRIDAQAVAGTQAGTDAGTGTGADAGTDAGADAGTDTDAGAGAGADAEKEGAV